jgi:hypothetical protein
MLQFLISSANAKETVEESVPDVTISDKAEDGPRRYFFPDEKLWMDLASRGQKLTAASQGIGCMTLGNGVLCVRNRINR